MKRKTLLTTWILLALAHGVVSAAYLKPALTQGDQFDGLVWWHGGKLYAQDAQGTPQELAVSTDETGHRTATAVIQNDVSGIALDYSFGWQSSLTHPTDELVLDFKGNVDVGYTDQTEWEGISGNGFMVGTDTFDMTIKMQNDKTLYVGTPLGSTDAAFGLIDYGNEGKTDSIDLNIIGGNIVTHYAGGYDCESLAVFGAWQNLNGGIKPGAITVNNQSINATLAEDFDAADTIISGTELNYGHLNINTNDFKLGTEEVRFDRGAWLGEESSAKYNTNNELSWYVEDYGALVQGGSAIEFSGAGNALLDVASTSVNTAGIWLTNKSTAITGETGINSLTIDGGCYGLIAQSGSNFNMKGQSLSVLNSKYGIYLDDSDAVYTFDTITFDNDTAGAYIEGGSNLNVIANELTVNNADYGFYAKENSELNISGGTLEVNADSYGVYLKNSHGKYNFNKLTLNSGKYGIYANEASTLDIMADELTVNNKSMDTNYGIYLNSASTGTFTAHSIRIENSKFGLLADDNSTLDVKNTGSYTFTNGSGDDDVAFSYLRNSKGELTIGTVDINNAGFGFNAREESSFTFKGNSIEFTNTRNAVKINDKSQADFEVGEFTVEGGAYALAAENKSKIDLSANVITVNLDDNTGNESAVYATDKSNIDITAASMTLIGNKSVYAHGYSKYTQKAEDVTLNGQVKAGDGASEIFSGVTDEGSGVVRISTTNKDAVTAYSYIYAPSSIEFNQATFINSQGDEEYHADKQGVRTNSAIRANRNSVITLDKAAGIYGDIIAGKGKIEKENVGDNDVNLDELSGGKITINSMEGATFKGDILAGNTGTIDFTLNNASYEGRVDDYADATLKHDVFRPGEFDVDVTEGGTVNMTLNDSTWTAHGQNFVTSLTFGESGGLVDLSQDENNSVTIRELNGDGTFHMLLNSENHALSDMLYIGKNTGIQTINIIGGITGGLEAISEDNPLRFATVGVDGSELPDVRNSGVRAYTRDAGALDLEYFVAKEEFDKADAENEAYNGTGKDETVDKPGNEFVENELVGDRDTAVNWIITGVREAKRSDAGKTVIAMSRANYSNAIYMDRLNKRMGEARYIDGDEGL